VLAAALLMAAMVLVNIMPAFAQGRGEGAQGVATGPGGNASGHEGTNPGLGLVRIQEEDRTVGANELKPLPFGGQDIEVLPGKPGRSTEEGTGSEQALENAPAGVVCTAPGSPFHPPGGC
jgi:hypothetical protein